MSVEFVGVELELRGDEAVYSDLQKIDRLLNSLGGRKKVDAGLQNLKRDILAATGELEKFQRKQRAIQQGFKSGSINKSDFWAQQLEEASKGAENARRHLQDLRQTQREVTLAQRQMGDTFKQTFNKISSSLTHAGSKMQTLGNALQKLTSPFERFTTGLLYGAGYKALNMITEGLSGSFTRADTMNKYVKLMEEYEKANYSAAQSRQDLDDSIQGLPIALDEAMSLAQRYTLSLGDMERGTQLAIATNNAFLASMATESQRYQGMLQLQDLMNGKDLTSREWMSLGSSMGKAINEVGLKLGYSKDQLGAFRQELYAGNIASKDFLDALIEVGTGSGKLVELAKVSAQTWEGLFANAKIAVTRLGANVIDTLNKTFEKATGRNLLQHLLGLDASGKEIGGGIKHAINDVSEAVQGWIKAHPEEILDFVNAFKSIDWKGFGRGLAEGMGDIAKVIKMLADIAGGKDLSGIGRRMIHLNMLGKGLTIFGGLLKGLSHPLAGIVTVLVRGGRSFKKRGLLGALGDLIAGESLSNLDTAAKKVDKGVPAMGKFSSGLSKIFKGWAQIATMIGGSAFVAWGSTKLFKGAFESIKEIGDIIADTDWKHAKWGVIGMGGFLTAFLGLSKLFGGTGGLTALKGGGILAGLTMIFSGAFWADMAMIKRGLKALSESVKLINTIIDDIDKIKTVGTVNTNNIDKAIKAFNKVTGLFKGEWDHEARETRGGLENFPKSYAESLKNLDESLKYMDEIADSITEINGLDFKFDRVEEVTTNMTTALSMVGRMVRNIPSIFKKQSTENTSKILKATIENVRKTFDAIVGTDEEGGLFNQIKGFNKRITKLIDEGVFTDLQSNMDVLSTALSGIWTKLNFTNTEDGFDPDAQFGGGGFNKNGGTAQLQNPTQIILAQIQNLAQAMIEIESVIASIQGIQKALKKVNLSDEGAFSFIEDIKKMVSQLSGAFSSEEIMLLAVKIAQFKSSLDSLKESLESIGSMGEGGGINVDITIVPTITGDTQTVDMLKKAHDNIKKQRDAIAKLSKSIHLSFPISVSMPGLDAAIAAMDGAAGRLRTARSNLRDAQGGGGSGGSGSHGSVTPMYQTMGGAIYRAKGGNIGFPGRPRGVDRVPIWGQAGEYMQSKKAVNFFGIDFMRKVNNLDMRGAMQELMTRAGSIANVGRNTVINNYYNNNQKVTQNINNPSPTFAVNSASRFAGAFK